MRFVFRSALVSALGLVLVGCSAIPAPTISEVEAPTIVPSELAAVLAGEPTTLVIHGSGFGDVRGLNRLFYGGIEVNDAVIAAWSDEAIELAFHHLPEIVADATLSGKSLGLVTTSRASRDLFVPPDQQRFEVRTLGGSAESDVTRMYYVRMDAWGSPTANLYLNAFDAFDNDVPGLEIDVLASAGTLDASTLTTDATGFAQTVWALTGTRPHTAKAIVDGRTIAQATVSSVAYRLESGPLYAASDVETTQPVTVLDADSQPVAGVEIRWILVSEYGSRFGRWDLGSHVTDASGLVELVLPPLDVAGDYDLYLFVDGTYVGDSWVRAGSPPPD
jgi:hypothetical protein